jgi:hypothetical protein
MRRLTAESSATGATNVMMGATRCIDNQGRL